MKNTHHLYFDLQDPIQSQRIKKMLFYLYIFISLFNTVHDMNTKNNMLNAQFFLNKTLPNFNPKIKDTLFLKSYFYGCTRIMIDEPLTLITHVMPYLRNYNGEADITNQDITGYFDIKKDVEDITYNDEEGYTPILPTVKKINISEENYKDTYFILKNFITGDAELEIDTDLLKQWDFYNLITQKLRISDKKDGPKILIFHTHAREKYTGGQSVVDAGEKLKQTLEKNYGIETMHVTSEFYADDTGSVANCYEIMEKSIKQILEENPSIQICIDIHRDGIIGNDKVLASVNNKEMAKMMFVNGLCMNRNVKGEIVQKEELENPFINDNLAFSFQAQIMANRYYPGLIKKIYLKEYRYSLHMKPLSLLVEIGNQNNTGEGACNATVPLADVIAKVIQKD